jgi:ComF family protein
MSLFAPRSVSSASTGFASLARRLLSPRCLLCATTRGDPLCDGCRADFFDARLHRCRQCALRFDLASGDLCGRCLRDPPAFDSTQALCDYAAPVDGLIVALKFGHRLDIASALGRLLAERLLADTAMDAPLLPVPLAFERQQERGFNQSAEIARMAARASGRRLEDGLLQRVRHRPAQEGLTLEARRRNVRGAFTVARGREGEIAGRAVTVVDDVMTSGSTLDEIARVLKRAGAASVHNAVVARTP